MSEYAMIEVIESTGPVPPEIEAYGPAPAYLVVDLGQGSPQGRADTEDEIRRVYKQGMNIIFMGNHKLKDGRIVSVGMTIDPLVAQMSLVPR